MLVYVIFLKSQSRWSHNGELEWSWVRECKNLWEMMPFPYLHCLDYAFPWHKLIEHLLCARSGKVIGMHQVTRHKILCAVIHFIFTILCLLRSWIIFFILQVTTSLHAIRIFCNLFPLIMFYVMSILADETQWVLPFKWSVIALLLTVLTTKWEADT
jgi:hypothetical protein